MEVLFTTSSDSEKKSHLSFFEFRKNSFLEKALDLQTLIGKFGLNIFPDFEATSNI